MEPGAGTLHASSYPARLSHSIPLLCNSLRVCWLGRIQALKCSRNQLPEAGVEAGALHTIRTESRAGVDSTAAAWPLFVVGCFALLLSVLVGLAIQTVQGYAGSGERGIALTGLLLAAVVSSPLLIAAVRRRTEVDLSVTGLQIAAALAIAMAGVCLFAAASRIFFPADILMWSEGEYVADIGKFRIGYPIFSAPTEFESFNYTPGSQLLTYGIAKLAGYPTSVPAFRVVQVAYAFATALIATLACRRLVELGGYGKRITRPWLWSLFWTPVFFLAATNAKTNPFTYLLHNDGLALLLSVTGYWLLLEYMATRSRLALLAMLAIPGLGFLVKQSVAIWAGLYAGYFWCFEEPRNHRRALLVSLAAFGGVGAAWAVCLIIWGHNFTYWVVTVMGHHPVNPLRSFQHVMDAWEFFAAGILGGLALLRFDRISPLLGAWLVWLGFLLVESYTSGIAWMINHLGPGSMIAIIWAAAATVRWWPARSAETDRPALWSRIIPVGAAIALFLLASNGLGFFRIPARELPDDVTRYRKAIEREFEGMDPRRVMLDYGTWVYLPSGTVSKDHAASAGEAGGTQTGDWSGILQRIQNRHYQRILVRGFHEPDFTYDHYIWAKPSGIRAALMANYGETRQIPAVQGMGRLPIWFKTVSVLEPKTP